MNAYQVLSTTPSEMIWKHFEKICQIPHSSGHEQKLREYIIAFADQNKLDWKTDSVGNLVICKPAMPGKEKSPGVILQGHIDMVPEKADDSPHDFLRDPISIQIDDEWLTAKGTTLGADNGIGVAAALAVLEATNISHGPVEALFTVQEETTMAGAQQLDGSMLDGTVLLNLDTEESKALYIGCAGGVNVESRYTCDMEDVPSDHTWHTFKISGLRGGHSGSDIHLQRTNAIQLMARLLKGLQPLGLRLSYFNGGTLDNAIPRTAEAQIGIPSKNRLEVHQLLDSLAQTIRTETNETEPDLRITFNESDRPSRVYSTQDQGLWLNALHSCFHGVKRYSDSFENVVETSNNLGVLKMENGSVAIDCFTRSLVDSSTSDLADNISGLFEIAGADVKQVGFFPGWKPEPGSEILKTMRQVYQQLFDHSPNIKVIHAALECGILCAAKPDMDMISFGPDIENPHTPDERVHIGSVDSFWRLLNHTLEKI